MAEYIERSAAIEAAKHAWAKGLEPSQYIEALPAADATQVVHGRWEMRPTGMATDTGPEYKAYCTICNEPNKQYRPPFCPHCGAKMDGGADNG